MCGIAGFFNRRSNDTLLTEMISQLHHRGPDGYGLYKSKQASLAHARLAIIDIEGGYQPMSNEDDTIWVSFNGEIYNFIELRTMLEKAFHHTFKTDSDTEVIVHLYETFGLQFPKYLNGQFAIALWDENEKQGMLVRDHVGIQPLFYYRNGSEITFASEVKAIFADRSIPRKLDRQEITNSLTYWTTAPGRSAFQDIDEVPPGHFLLTDNLYGERKVKIHKWWDHEYRLNHDDRKHLPDMYSRATDAAMLFDNAVSLRLRSDVPVGTYVSGGVDSSLIAMLAHRNQQDQMQTFSIGFQDEQFDESSYQAKILGLLDSKHHGQVCTDDNIASAFDQVVFHTEKPILRTAPVPMYWLSHRVREEGIKVVLTGEGADEVFAGYDLFRENFVRRMLLSDDTEYDIASHLKALYPWMNDKMISSNIDVRKTFFRGNVTDTSLTWFSHEPRWRTTSSKTNALMTPDMPRADFEQFASLFPGLDDINDPLNRAQYLEFHTLFNGYLISSQGDRMLMANGVEGRFPFLDPHVIRYGNHLHNDDKMSIDKFQAEEKWMVKLAAEIMGVPSAITRRSKQPYMAPDGSAFVRHGRFHEHYRQHLLASNRFFDTRKVEILIKKFEQGLATGFPENMALIGMLSTNILHHRFCEALHLSPPAYRDQFKVWVDRTGGQY